MNFLLDTNVVSEWVKPDPDPGVVAWLAEADEDRVFISVVTLAELRHGVERMSEGRRRKRLDQWLKHELPVRFEGRVLGVDPAVANAWGEVMARREDAGRPMDPMDAFIAAIASVHALTVVTRNESDFELSVGSLVNPWRPESG